MRNYKLIEKIPTAKELSELRILVGWGIPNEKDLKIGLDNSLYGVCVFSEENIIGTARVIGDKSTCFYIQDVIVHPEHQRKGIGLSIMKKIMSYIGENACHEAIVGLMSAKGKENFYEKFGFWTRPTEHFGPGMIQFWKKE